MPTNGISYTIISKNLKIVRLYTLDIMQKDNYSKPSSILSVAVVLVGVIIAVYFLITYYVPRVSHNQYIYPPSAYPHPNHTSANLSSCNGFTLIESGSISKAVCSWRGGNLSGVECSANLWGVDYNGTTVGGSSIFSSKLSCPCDNINIPNLSPGNYVIELKGSTGFCPPGAFMYLNAS